MGRLEKDIKHFLFDSNGHISNVVKSMLLKGNPAHGICQQYFDFIFNLYHEYYNHRLVNESFLTNNHADPPDPSLLSIINTYWSDGELDFKSLAKFMANANNSQVYAGVSFCDYLKAIKKTITEQITQYLQTTNNDKTATDIEKSRFYNDEVKKQVLEELERDFGKTWLKEPNNEFAILFDELKNSDIKTFAEIMEILDAERIKSLEFSKQELEKLNKDPDKTDAQKARERIPLEATINVCSVDGFEWICSLVMYLTLTDSNNIITRKLNKFNFNTKRIRKEDIDLAVNFFANIDNFISSVENGFLEKGKLFIGEYASLYSLEDLHSCCFEFDDKKVSQNSIKNNLDKISRDTQTRLFIADDFADHFLKESKVVHDKAEFFKYDKNGVPIERTTNYLCNEFKIGIDPQRKYVKSVCENLETGDVTIALYVYFADDYKAGVQLFRIDKVAQPQKHNQTGGEQITSLCHIHLYSLLDQLMTLSGRKLVGGYNIDRVVEIESSQNPDELQNSLEKIDTIFNTYCGFDKYSNYSNHRFYNSQEKSK